MIIESKLDKLIPRSIDIGERQLAFSQIHQEFGTTIYGKILQENIRYAPFKPEGVTNQDWEKILGVDVNNYSHLLLSLALARSFLSHCDNAASIGTKLTEEAKFTADERRILLATAVVHDWGEAIIGDINYLDKTELDEAREMIVVKKLVCDILGDSNSIPECEKLAENICDVLVDKTSKLGRAFNAIEVVGYERTGLRAWQQSNRLDGELASNLIALAYKVVPYWTPRLVEYSAIYPPIQSYLAYHYEAISDILYSAEKNGKFIHDGRGIEESRRLWFDHFMKNQKNHVATSSSNVQVHIKN